MSKKYTRCPFCGSDNLYMADWADAEKKKEVKIIDFQTIHKEAFCRACDKTFTLVYKLAGMLTYVELPTDPPKKKKKKDDD